MAERILVQPGCDPWAPRGLLTHLSEIYNQYDVPTVGIVSQNAVQYLFRCLWGADNRISIWGYTVVGEVERDKIHASEPEEFDDVARSIGDSHPGVLALAVEGFGIVAAVDVDDWSDLDEAHEILLTALDGFVDRLSESSDDLRTSC